MKYEVEVTGTTIYKIDDSGATIYAVEGGSNIAKITVFDDAGERVASYDEGNAPEWLTHELGSGKAGEMLESARTHGCEVRDDNYDFEAPESEREQLRKMVHRAEPGTDDHAFRCRHCSQRIRLVPGGQGPTWVHDESGAVAAYGAERP